MAKGIFGNNKFALGFAGVTVAFAAIAAMGVNLFVPGLQQDGPQDTIVEIDADQGTSRPTPPRRAPQTWAAEDSLSDDWNTSSTGSGNSKNAWSNAARSRKPEVEFEDFELERPGAQQADRQMGSPRSASNNGARIVSNAAPGAAPAKRPGRRDPPPASALERVR